MGEVLGELESGAVPGQTDDTSKIQQVVRADVAASGDTLAALGAPQLRALGIMKDPFGYVRTRAALAAVASAVGVYAVISGWPDGRLWPHIALVPIASAFLIFFGPYLAAICVAMFINPLLLVELLCALSTAIRKRMSAAQPAVQADRPEKAGPSA